MTKRLGLLLLILPAVLPTLGACAADSSKDTPTVAAEELRGLTKAEALADYNQIGDNIRSFYGPLEYKREKFGFNLDTAMAAGRSEIAASRTEADRVRVFYKLLAQLRDGHVSLQYGMRGDASPTNSLLFLVTPVEQTYVVAGVGGGLAIGRGDELVSIDGLTPRQMADLLGPIQQIGTPESTAHDVAASMTFRPFYAPKELAPKAATASVVLKKADGSRYTVEVPWTMDPGGIAGQIMPPTPAPPAPPTESVDGGAPPAPHASTLKNKVKNRGLIGRDAMFSARANFIVSRENPQASVLQVGAANPFFLTEAVTAAFQPTEVKPKAETLTKYGVTLPPAADPTAASYIALKAFKYKHAGKTVMLVRIPQFSVPQDNYEENVAWLSALIEENQGAATGTGDIASTPADVIVLDGTHNPGGSVSYVHGLASLFLKAPSGMMVQANHSDRKWLGRHVAMANMFNEIPGFPPEFTATVLERSAKAEAAFDQEKWLAPYLPLTGSNLGPLAEFTAETFLGADLLKPHPLGHWEKPVLVIHDELSGSGGDAFPAILQESGVKTFGARTMGLGGTVEPVGQLTNSGASLNLTRGINGIHRANGAPRLIENLGVTPDYPYAHTVADFRAGFPAYVKAFSDVAVSLAGPQDPREYPKRK